MNVLEEILLFFQRLTYMIALILFILNLHQVICYISGKVLTKDSGFLDEIPPFCSIMADKGFSLFDECAGRNFTKLYHVVLPK